MKMNAEIKALLLSLSSADIGEIKIQRPSADRLLKPGRMLRSVLGEHSLHADIAETICQALHRM